MSRTSITIGVVMLLCLAWFAYSLGWLGWPRSNDALEGSNIGGEQRLDREEVNEDAVRLTSETAMPADTIPK